VLIIYPLDYCPLPTTRIDPMKEDSSISSNGENAKSDDGSGSGTSGTTSKGTQDASTPAVRVALGQKENALVWRSRMLVLLVLLVATISVSFITYHFTEREEKEDFKTRVSLLFWTTGRTSDF
jgi:hypothetical protein